MEVPTNNKLQVIMANQPRMLRQMLGRILNRSKQVNLIGEVTTTNKLPLLVELLHPDWVVLTLCKNGSFPSIADTLCATDPKVGILAVTENGARVRARYGEMTFEGMALDDLVRLIRPNPSFPC